MKYNDLIRIIEHLEFDAKTVICEQDGVILYIMRPSKIPKKLKNKYELKRNFQIWLKEGEREFRPNHLRVMIDLNLRTRSRPDLKRKMLLLFDSIFYGSDPEEEIKELKNEKFEHYLNSLKIIAHISQLFLAEQDFNYDASKSKFDPATLFLQGWIREFIDSPKEIDNMCMSVCRRQPPRANYVNKENKKHKKYEKNLRPLWYLSY